MVLSNIHSTYISDLRVHVGKNVSFVVLNNKPFTINQLWVNQPWFPRCDNGITILSDSLNAISAQGDYLNHMYNYGTRTLKCKRALLFIDLQITAARSYNNSTNSLLTLPAVKNWLNSAIYNWILIIKSIYSNKYHNNWNQENLKK